MLIAFPGHYARKVGDMQKVNPSYLFFFGHHVNGLLFMRPDTPIAMKEMMIYPALSALEQFTENPKSILLFPRSTDIAVKLLAEVKTWGTGGEKTLSDLAMLHANVQSFSVVLNEDLERSHNFLLTDKGNLSVDRLVDRASKKYNPDILSLIDARTVSEIDDAGKCLACALYTACGFHILRSVEMAVKAYVYAAKGALPVEKQRSWGIYIQWLAGTASTNVIDALTILKGKRNPLMHPQHTLTESQAISIFCLCEAVLESIADDVKGKPLEAKFIAAFEAIRQLEAVS